MGRMQPPRGKLTLRVAKKDPHPCPWGPSFASEEELNGHPRVNTLVLYDCGWAGSSPPLFFLPPSSLSLWDSHKAPLPKATDISAPAAPPHRPASPVPSSSSTRALEGPQQDQRDWTSGCSCLNPAPCSPHLCFPHGLPPALIFVLLPISSPSSISPLSPVSSLSAGSSSPGDQSLFPFHLNPTCNSLPFPSKYLSASLPARFLLPFCSRAAKK